MTNLYPLLDKLRFVPPSARPNIISSLSYGTINSPGFNLHNASVMNAPYGAYVVGDYTGLTPPY